MASILIEHGLVVTMDARRRIIADGALYVEGDRIVELGKSADLSARYLAAASTVIDASDKLVLPGFIDGHNHPGQYLSKGIADDVDIMTWLYDRVYPYEAHVTPEDAHVGALGNFVEMIRTGTTCFADPGGYYVGEVARAMQEVGIRGILSRSTRDLQDPAHPVPPNIFESTAENLARVEDLYRTWHGRENDRIRVWFSIRTNQNASDELCAGSKALADKYGAGLHIHCSGNRGEVALSEKMFGARPIERYRRLGMVDDRLYLIHMGWVDAEEIALLKERDVRVCHTPAHAMHGATGSVSQCAFPKMIAAGITVSLGSDSVTAGRFMDMVRIMYLAACAYKDLLLDPLVMGAYKALEMATIDGARALHWDDQIGSLEVGKKADVVLFDLSRPEWQPMRDPIANLVYGADGSSVDTVLIDGRVVMRHGKLQTVDERAVVRQVASTAQQVMDRAGIRIQSPWPVE